MLSIPRESVQYVELDVTATDPAGLPVDLGSLEAAVVLSGSRPVDWTATTTIGGRQHLLVQGLTPGSYAVYGRIVDSPETPVFVIGSIQIT